jgi:hypothetical protein
MSTDVTTSPTHDLMRAAQLPPETAEALRALFDTTTPLVTPGFHGPLDIPTLVGLPGSYLWFEDPFAVRVIQFTFDSDKIGFQGHYTLTSGLAVVEQGTFHCVPNNAAVGFAFLALSPAGGTTRAWPISGMVTDPLGRITVLLLGEFVGQQLVTRFTAVRLV